MKIKITVSLSIFSLLLLAAWFLHQQQTHLEVNKMDSSLNNLNTVPMNYEIIPLNANVSTENNDIQWKLYMPYRPREYVRIIGYE
ncbi:hypothetical protein ABC255_11245 [Neobacillus sp. 3P2-tot-E-2]|uniref:hypothetical protein n=1 Tax=Neobacillus sp. 3P2-tot-E-2 TaxID=3132212 RepID=UPI0039A26953